MYGDYIKFLSFIDDTPLFNKESFLISKVTKERNFYDEFTETQMFNQLVQNKKIKESSPYFHNESIKFLNYQNSMVLSMNRRSSASISSVFGNVQKYSISGPIKSLVSNDSSEDSYGSENENENIFVLRPYFIPETQDIMELDKLDKVFKKNCSYEKQAVEHITTKSYLNEIGTNIDYEYYVYSLPETSNTIKASKFIVNLQVILIEDIAL